MIVPGANSKIDPWRSNLSIKWVHQISAIGGFGAITGWWLVHPYRVDYNDAMRTLPGDIPSARGTYVVLLRLKKRRSIAVGKLSGLDLLPGWYAYAGSAMGPGGLAARIGRHYRRRKKMHWHIDYLRPFTRMEGIFFVADQRRREHIWAQYLGKTPLSGQPINGFGATDCNCATHLYHFTSFPEPRIMASMLEAHWISLSLGPKNR